MYDFQRLTSRRAFMRRGLGLVSAGATIPLWLDRTAFALEAPDDTPQPGDKPGRPSDHVLVVLQLSGGNDVLSSVVPYGDPEYYAQRRVTAIPATDVLKVDDHIGFNKAMAPLKNIYDRGDIHLVQAVQYPNPNRSHFHSMAIWHSCNTSNPELEDGWLARHVAAEGTRRKLSAIEAISLGAEAPKALVGRSYRGIAFQDARSFSWRAGDQDKTLVEAYRQLNAPREGATGSPLDFLATTAMEANAATDQVRNAVGRFRPKGTYQGALGRDLAAVAAMIVGGLSTRLFYVQHGGYDTHSTQKPRHDRLMTELSSNLAAFMQDLAHADHDQRVVVMGFSEFSRRVKENASGGTDHGAAGAMFLVGSPIAGGITGTHPSLTDLDNGDLKWQVDFRQVYSTVIDRWLGGDSKALFGQEFAALNLF